MRFLLFCLFALLSAPAHPLVAKPLLTSSEDSYGLACLRYEDTPERLVQICSHALEEPGATRNERVDFKDSLALAYMEMGHHDQARVIYDEILETDPASTVALNGIGWIHYELSEYKRARDRFETSIAIAPTASGLAGLGGALYRGKTADHDTALSYLDAALALSQDYLWAMRERGWLLLDADRLDESADSFGQALELNTEDFNANLGKANVLLQMEKYEAALEYVNRAAMVEPENAWVFIDRSDILRGLGRNAQALRDGERAVKLEPDWTASWLRQAWALEDLGNRGKALGIMGEAATRIGYDNDLVYWTTRMLYADTQYEAAYLEIRRNTEHGNGQVEDLTLLVDVEIELGRYKDARNTMARVFEYDPKGAATLFFDALLMVYENEFDGAESRFAEAVEAGLETDQAQFIVEAMIDQGQIARAIKFRMKY